MKLLHSLTSTRIWIGLGLFLTLLVWFLPWRFQVNDDEVMMWLVSGAYTGTPESFAVFIHPILSGIFSGLYSWIPAVPWYPITWFVLLFLSYGALIHYNAQFSGRNFKGICWDLLLLASLIHFSFFLQFSIVASFCITAGLVCRFGKNEIRSKILPSDLLIFAGVLIRWEVGIVLIGGTLAGLLFWRKEKNWIRAAILPVALLLICILSKIIWVENSNLDQFTEINRLRSQVFDHPMLQLEKENWKEKDLSLYHFSNGLQDFQSDELGEQTLRKWKKDLDSSRMDFLGLDYLIKAWLTFVQQEHFFLFLFAISILQAILGKKKPVLWALLWIFLGFNLLLPFYLLKIQVFVLAFFLILIFQLLWEDQNPILKSLFHLTIAGLLILGIVWHIVSIFSSEKNIPDNSELIEILADLKAEGISEVYLVGQNKWYHSLVFENPLPFKILGWSSLLELHQGNSATSKKAFLVQTKTYISNAAYFQEGNPKIQYLEEFVLITYP